MEMSHRAQDSRTPNEIVIGGKSAQLLNGSKRDVERNAYGNFSCGQRRRNLNSNEQFSSSALVVGVGLVG